MSDTRRQNPKKGSKKEKQQAVVVSHGKYRRYQETGRLAANKARRAKKYAKRQLKNFNDRTRRLVRQQQEAK